jgi:uncharacterized protein (TIGR01777 family)
MMSTTQILLTGSSGLIGTSLIRMLQQERISTICLERKKNQPSRPQDAAERFWDPYAAEPVSNPQSLAGVTGAIHLSGANLSGRRWTEAYKREIVASRVKPTRALAVMLAGLRPKPSVLVCASAVGIYGGRGDELLTEDSTLGPGFLAETCLAWEQATAPAEDAGIRVVHARFGVVLSPQGGALAQMLPIFRLGLGGPLGNGRQWLSWVALSDVTRALVFTLNTENLAGPVNVVAPQPVTNVEFTRVMGQVLHRPAVLPVPAVALRVAFGEMAQATILESQRALPARLESAGFAFEYPDLPAALHAALTT